MVYPNHKITEIVNRFGRELRNRRISEIRPDGRISTFFPFNVGRNDLEGSLCTTYMYPNPKITKRTLFAKECTSLTPF